MLGYLTVAGLPLLYLLTRMPLPTPEIRRWLAELAQRYEVSENAALAAFHALSEGGGRMAQFHHPELGGGVQWMRGGMILIGEIFNNALKARVDGLCTEISERVLAQAPSPPTFAPYQGPQRDEPNTTAGASAPTGEGASAAAGPAWGAPQRWWPETLGPPSAAGTQYGLAYALFADQHRVALRSRGQVRIYDSLDHRITGIAQRQRDGEASVTFTSQHGAVALDRLPLVDEYPDPSSDGA